jgi:hypothetical protein
MQPVPCAGCQALQRRLRDLQAQNERLRRQLDEATRAGLSHRKVTRCLPAVARGRLGNRLSEVISPPRTNAVNERLAQHLWNHRDEAQSVLMSVWRTCWQQGCSALDFLSQLLRGLPVAPALPP